VSFKKTIVGEGMVAETSVRNYTVELCTRKDIKDFVEKWHYSKSINGLRIDYCFRLMRGDEIIGVMIYGKMAMANCWKKYADEEKDVIELRRLCCIDDTLRNTEFILFSILKISRIIYIT
jgi:hypothetical protein